MKLPLAPMRLICLFIGLVGLTLPGAAWAEVELAFYSRELGANNFPHAFVTVEGSLADGTEVDSSYGFTAKSISPGILLGSVGGKVINEPESYVAKSDRQFTLTLSDEEYSKVMAVVERWRAKRQPSYNLNGANCVHFVAEIAEAVGLQASVPKSLRKKPRSFLLAVKAENEALIDRRAATLEAAARP